MFESHEITSAKQSSFEKEQNKDRFAKRGGVKWSRCQSTPNLGNMNKDNAELDELKKPRQTDIGAILKVLSKIKIINSNLSRKRRDPNLVAVAHRESAANREWATIHR